MPRCFLLAAATLLAVACSSDPPPPASPPTQAADGGAPEPGAGVPPDGADPAPSDLVSATTETLEVAGKAREYVLVVPKDLDAGRAYPVVFAFHGDGGTGPGLRKAWPFDAVTGKDAIVVYPTGIGRTWDLYTPTAQNEDIAFLEGMIASLGQRFSIDPARVFGTGYSNGGFFINQVACRKSGLFRAIASHAGGAPYEPPENGAGQWPNGFVKCNDQQTGIAAIVFHGTADGAVLPDSGEFDATYWAAVNGCSDTRSPVEPAPCLAHASCPADKPVVWCLVPGLNHWIWSEGARTSWAFFQAL